jgi:hypothetical protein
MREIAVIEFSGDNQPSIYTESGSKDRFSTLRCKIQGIRAVYNPATGEITIYNRKGPYAKRDGVDGAQEYVMHISSVKLIQLEPEALAPSPATSSAKR